MWRLGGDGVVLVRRRWWRSDSCSDAGSDGVNDGNTYVSSSGSDGHSNGSGCSDDGMKNGVAMKQVPRQQLVRPQFRRRKPCYLYFTKPIHQ